MTDQKTDKLVVIPSPQVTIWNKGDPPLDPPMFVTKTSLSEVLGMQPGETLTDLLQRIQNQPIEHAESRLE